MEKINVIVNYNGNFEWVARLPQSIAEQVDLSEPVEVDELKQWYDNGVKFTKELFDKISQ